MFTLKIATNNEAFYPSAADEIARILHKLADRLEAGQGTGSNLLDLNGNTVGSVSWKLSKGRR